MGKDVAIRAVASIVSRKCGVEEEIGIRLVTHIITCRELVNETQLQCIRTIPSLSSCQCIHIHSRTMKLQVVLES